MYQFFVEPQQIHVADKSVTITGNDVNHIKNVLRMKIGEEIAVSNGQDGKEYRCGIREYTEDAVLCEPIHLTISISQLQQSRKKRLLIVLGKETRHDALRRFRQYCHAPWW